MRKVFLENLPRWENGAYKGKINWRMSMNKKVKFIYDNFEGEVEIVDYIRQNNKKRYKIVLKYLDKDNFQISPDKFLRCQLQSLLKLRNKEYSYNIGDVIKTKTGKIKILNQIRMTYNSKKQNIIAHKGYEYECLNCGNRDNISESNILHDRGCNVCCCTPKKVVKGINDIATTHPELMKYFVNKDDAYKYTYSSNVRIPTICPVCRSIKNITINKLYYFGFGCLCCGDKISYPNKFIFNVLSQIKHLKFKSEKSFNWSINKKYDFYIPSINCIIEAHGLQHYDRTFSNCGGRTLLEEQENDKLKEILSKENGIEHYVVIDCRKSELEFIKQNILNSQLSKLFNLNKIDWLKCHEYACNTLVKEACQLWNNGNKSVSIIATRLKKSIPTVKKYLRQGSELKWCNYNPVESKYISSKSQEKKVLCIENDMIFKSITEVELKSLEIFNVKLYKSSISKVCRGEQKTYKGYHFKFI